MTNQEIIDKFKSILEKDRMTYITPVINGTSFTSQGINFDICNIVPDKTTRTYLKIDSLQQAKKIWTEVLDDLPKEKQVDKVFDKFVPSNLDLTDDLFLCIYSGNK